MTRGKNASAVSARLREQLRAANEARQRVEARLERTERERDQAVARLMRIEASEHPAIEAERARAEHAAAETRDAVLAERDRWRGMVDASRRTVSRMIAALPADAQVFEADLADVAALAEMYGGEIARGLPRSNRNMRRNAANAAQVRWAFRQSAPESVGPSAPERTHQDRVAESIRDGQGLIVAAAARLVGLDVEDVEDVSMSPFGVVISTVSCGRFVVVPDDGPDRDGRSGVMRLDEYRPEHRSLDIYEALMSTRGLA